MKQKTKLGEILVQYLISSVGLRLLDIFLTNYMINILNPRTAKLFQLTFAAKGGVCCNPPGFWSSRPNLFVKFFMGIVSGSRNPKVIVRIFYLYHVTLKLKVIDLERER